MPDLKGMPAMDAIALLENLDVDVEVKLVGTGKVVKQSIAKSVKLKSKQIIELEAS